MRDGLKYFVNLLQKTCINFVILRNLREDRKCMLFCQRIRENGHFYTIFANIFVNSVKMTKYLILRNGKKAILFQP